MNPSSNTLSALRKLTVAWPLVICLFLPALARAETAVQAWALRYNGPGNADDKAFAVALDNSNNVIVTGGSAGSGGDSDYATIKYSSVGLPLWTNRYNGPGNDLDVATAVAVDGSNNVVVTGYSTGSEGYFDFATIKYSSAGLPLWTNRYHGPWEGFDSAKAVVVDGSNNVIVTGSSSSSSHFPDCVTIKYSSTGAPLWTNRYNGPGNESDSPYAVAVDGSNCVIVVGYSISSGTSADYATVKYSSEGLPLWTNLYNGPGYATDIGTAVAVDGSNSVIVAGFSIGTGNSFDYATIKYSSVGVPLWTNRYNGPTGGNDYAMALAVDGNNDVIVTGHSTNAASGYDYATIKYSSAGVLLWTNRYNGPANGNDYADVVAVDGSNNVIVTGYSTPSAGGYDYATIKYSSAGLPLWTNRYNGPANGSDTASAMVLDHSGNVIVSGLSTGSGGDYDFATIKYICVPEPVLTGLQLTNGNFQMRVDDLLQPGTLVIEAATSLADWAPVFTNTAPTNVLFYTDPDAGNSPTRFYRAFQFP